MKILLGSLLTGLMFLLVAKPAFASPIINEVYPRPTIDEKEWIELFNNSDDVIDLSGWVLMDELSSPSIIYQFLNESSNQNESVNLIEIEPQLLESQLLEPQLFLFQPQSFLVIEIPTSKLNNAGDTVKLINDQGQIIDQFEYFDSEAEMSFSIILNNSGEKEIVLAVPTKGENNIKAIDSQITQEDDLENPNPTEESVSLGDNEILEYQKLVISEIMACPETNKSEWIKIYNPNIESVNLSNWQIVDAVNNQISIESFDNIAGLESKIINLSSNILNNSGDSVSLFNPDNLLIDKFSYANCTIGVPLTINNPTNDQAIDQTTNQTNQNQIDDKMLTEDESLTAVEEKRSESIVKTQEKIRLTKINSLLEIINIDKSSSNSASIIKSKRIPIKQKSLAKSAIISVIIGGAVLSGSGLLFINKSDEKIHRIT